MKVTSGLVPDARFASGADKCVRPYIDEECQPYR